MRYTYYSSKSREKCENAIEQGFADGTISECERPEIKILRQHKKIVGYSVTLLGD